MLVVREDFHPALVPLLLTTATRIHGKGDEISDPGEFPSGSYCDFTLSEDAALLSVRPARAAASPPLLAGVAGRSGQGDAHPDDHADDAVAPGDATADALANSAQDLSLVFGSPRDRPQSDQRSVGASQSTRSTPRLKDIEHQVAYVDVPLSYVKEFYHLRLHLALLQQYLTEPSGLAASRRISRPSPRRRGSFGIGEDSPCRSSAFHPGTWAVAEGAGWDYPRTSMG